MKFTKMHGAGNDFIIIDNLAEKLDISIFKDLAVKMCNRRTSVGADGLMVVEKPTEEGHIKMLFFNSDGTHGEMCGNGARCISRFAVERGYGEADFVKIETGSGIVVGERITKRKYKVRLNPITYFEENGLIAIGDEFHVPVEYTYVEMGTPGLPHLLVNKDSLDDSFFSSSEFKKRAASIRNHPAFEKGTNVNFYRIVSDDEINLATFERGVEDFTLACGTGAGSTVAALNKMKLVGDYVKVNMPGGLLEIQIEGEDIYLTGPTNMVCNGDFLDEDFFEVSDEI